MSDQVTTTAVSPWMNSTAAARYLGRGRRFVLREIRAGRLKAATIGGRGEILTNARWLDEWVTTQTRPVLMASGPFAGRRV